MSAETIKTIVGCVYIVISIVSFFILLILKTRQLKKVKNDTIALESSKELTDAVNIILQQVPLYISFAENIFGAGCGDKKLHYVLENIKNICSTFGVNYDGAYFADYVESILATPTKKVECVKEQESL